MAKKHEFTAPDTPIAEADFPKQSELRPEGAEGGGAEVGLAERKREDGSVYYQLYHLERDGKGGHRKVYHDIPEGHAIDAEGRVTAKGA